MSFPDNFVWGAAASSYQIEGGAYDDGKGLSIWDMFCRIDDKIYDGHTGEVACDHYHRHHEDVALMKEMGLQAYRLSISWPRVLPDGVGTVNPAGLDFYDSLIDALLAAGIQPYVTLYHWDLPLALHDRGGWQNPDIPDWFAEYAEVIGTKLGDRVQYWMTVNEPNVFVGLGYRWGVHAPGFVMAYDQTLRIGHHVLLAHGKAVQALRATVKDGGKIGFASAGRIAIPHTADDIGAARSCMFDVNSLKMEQHVWWCDPIFLGRYPEDGVALAGDKMPPIGPNDMAIISQPLDFCGMNAYGARRWQWDAEGKPQQVARKPGRPASLMDWEISPEVLYWVPKFLYERYGKPILVTENGLSNMDWVSLDGKVHDPQRIDCMHRYLLQYRRAAEDGVPLLGYLHWSLMDNFEWARGMQQRFGLIYIDYETQQRTLKDSALWYRDVIASNGENL